MVQIDSLESLKKYLMEYIGGEPDDISLRLMYKFIDRYGAKPHHIKLAFAAGLNAQKIDE